MERAEFYVNVKELAAARGLEFAEVTSGRNGYPQGLRPAIVGFESLSDYNDFVEKLEDIVHEWCDDDSVEFNEAVLRRKDGWGLYEDGGFCLDPSKGLSNVCDDDTWADVNEYDDEIEYLHHVIYQDSCDREPSQGFDELINTLKHHKELCDAKSECENGEEIYFDCNGNIVKRASGLTSYSEDVWHYELGVEFYII